MEFILNQSIILLWKSEILTNKQYVVKIREETT